MKMKCSNEAGEEHWHDASPTALLMFIEAVREGDTLKMTPTGVTFRCVMHAITEERVFSMKRRYKGNRIIVDGKEYDIRHVA